MASWRTAGETPWALKMTRAPSGTSASSSTKMAPACAQFFNHVAVVDDFLTDVDGRAVEIEGDFDNVDGAHDAGAKTAGFQEQNLLLAAAGGGLGRGIDID